MKSIRLNKSIRDSIVANIVEAWKLENKEPEVPTAPSKQSLVEKAYKDWRSKAQIDKLLLMGMSTEYVNTVQNVYLQVTDAKTSSPVLSTSQYFHDKAGNIERRIYSTSGGLNLLNTDQVYLEWRAEHDAYVKQNEVHNVWVTAKNGYASDIHAVLDSVNTTKQLVEAWPEVEKYIPSSFRDPSTVHLPAMIPTLPKGE